VHPDSVLALQRLAGNRAVAGLLTATAAGRAPALVVQRVACPVTGEFTECPEGPQEVARHFGGRVGFGFTVRARFRPTTAQAADGQPCDPRRGEYRQYVRGKFEIGGKPVKHKLFGGQPMTVDTFQEDGQGGIRYGHRDGSTGYHSDFYDDEAMDRRNTERGEYFQCTDNPMMPPSPGKGSRMQLEFVGQLIDTGNVTVLQQRGWSANALTFPGVGGATSPDVEE